MGAYFMKKYILSALLSAALLSSSMCADVPLINSEKELYRLIKDNKAMKYDIRKKELSFHMHPTDAKCSAALCGFVATLFTFAGITVIKDAHLARHPLEERMYGSASLFWGFFMFLMAGISLKNDFTILLSPQGIKTPLLHGGNFVKWSEINNLKRLEEIKYGARMRDILFLEKITKDFDHEKKETFFEIRAAAVPAPFDLFLAIIRYYHATYGTLK
jgi:hypothetical protein